MSSALRIAAAVAFFASNTAMADDLVRGECIESAESSQARVPAWQCYSCTVDLLYLGSPGSGWYPVSGGSHEVSMAGARADLIDLVTDLTGPGYWTTATALTPAQYVNTYATCSWDPEFTQFMPPRTWCEAEANHQIRVQ